MHVRAHISLKPIQGPWPILLCTLLFLRGLGSQDPKKNFRQDFSRHVFVENKGQFNEVPKTAFVAHEEGAFIYFTPKGIVVKRESINERRETEEEKAHERNAGKKEEEGKENKVAFSCSMEWIGASSSCELVAEEAVSFYYTYSNLHGRSLADYIKAKAYKKIVYRDLYPGIDVEYTFPENKPGLKYTIFVHPGADASQIKMKYDTGLELDKTGNILIGLPFGNIIDHAPASYQEGGVSIPSAFIVKNKTVSFSLAPHDHSKTLIIDPWTTLPTFTGQNAAYDIDHDTQGNVYVYGGTSPYEAIKFNSAGVIQWVFTANLLATYNYYGDILMAGNYIYLSEGLHPNGAKVIKLDANGIPVTVFPGNPVFQEMWRMVYNSCLQQAIIAGGGYINPVYQACILDSSLSTLNPVNVISTTDICHDISLLALDNANDCYMAFTSSVCGNPALFNNVLVKSPGSTLFPPNYIVPDNHGFVEAGIAYPGAVGSMGSSTATGFNGIAVSDNYLYTYDGRLIQRWNKVAGTLINSAVIGSIPFKWGGLAVDDCDNIYAGLVNSIVKYDTNFSVISAYPLTDTVYDIQLGINKLYACGVNFVTQIDLPPAPFPLTTSSTPAGCFPTGTASVQVASCTRPPYTYLWIPGGQTTATATGLNAGNYTVIVGYSSCKVADTATVTVTSVTVSPTVTVNVATICIGDSDTLFAGGANSYSWSPATGLSITTGSVSIANPTSTNVYTVTGTVGTCTASNTATVTVNNLPVVSANSGTICLGQQTETLTATGASTYTWTPAGGLSTTTGASVTANPGSTTVYTITGTDINSCVNTSTTSVLVNPLPVITVNNSTICTGSSATLTANGATTYTWSTLNVGAMLVAAPASTTSYTVVGTDNNSCVNAATTTITVNPLPVVNVNSPDICTGASTTLTATGAVVYTWSPSGGLSSSVGSPVTANPASTTSYTVTGFDANNCSNTAVALVTANSLPTLTVSSTAICTGSTGTLSAAGANTYTWNPVTGLSSANGAIVTVNINTTSSYTVIGIDINGCMNSAISTVTMNPLPVILISPPISSGCAPLCVNFSNTTAAIGTCNWMFGDGTTSTSCNPVHCFSGAGTFWSVFTLTDANNCTAYDTAQVIVYPVPQADFNLTPQPTTILDPLIHFYDASVGANIVTWNWNFGAPGNSTSTQQNPDFNYTEAGSYPVTLMATSDYGCVDTIVKIIIIQPEWMIYVPNAFSPNFDGTNDVFMAKGEGIKEFKLYVFDRWGMQVFFSEDLYVGWDGRFQSKGKEIVQEDVYVWKIELRNIKGEPHNLKGTVTLIR